MTLRSSIPQLPRRALLKVGGALIAGFAFAPRFAYAAEAAGSPDAKRVDSWIVIHADNTATLQFGKVELGQGNATGLMQIVGEELDLGMDQMRVAPFISGITPDQGSTVASLSIREGGPQLRQAAAETRQALLQMASVKWGVPESALSVSRGMVSGPAGKVSYGELIGGKIFDIAFTGTAPLKSPAQFTLVGTRVPRVDIPAKADNSYVHMHNVRVPGMWHGRVVRPRGQGALGPVATVLEVDESSIAGIPNVRVVRKGNFVGVVAPDEWNAIQAAEKLHVRWDIGKTLPGDGSLFEVMKAAKPVDNPLVDKGDIPSALMAAVHVVSAQYRAPYQMHASFAPNCAIADVNGDVAEIVCASQVPYAVRNLIANVTGLAVEKIRIRRFEGAGTFGHSAYDDVAQAAAILSQAVEKPVRVQFMRWDEHGWECYGPAHIGEVTAAIDAQGKIIAYDYQGWQHGWNATEPSEQLAIGTPPKTMAGGGGATSVNPNCAGGMYAVANRRVLAHNIPGLGLLKGSFLRSPLDVAAAFASEQTIDELALVAKMDPYLFRKLNITDARWLGVLDAAAKSANWQPRLAHSLKQSGDIVTGRGIGLGTHFTSYGAAVAEVRVNRKTGQIVATHMHGAIDCGLCINPALVENQISGMMMQAVSRMLHEEVTFSETGVTSLDWGGYPVLRFDEHPEVTAVVVQRTDQPSTGAGEEVLAAGGAAIANALFDATGVRLRQFPLMPQRVRAALSA